MEVWKYGIVLPSQRQILNQKAGDPFITNNILQGYCQSFKKNRNLLPVLRYTGHDEQSLYELLCLTKREYVLFDENFSQLENTVMKSILDAYSNYNVVSNVALWMVRFLKIKVTGLESFLRIEDKDLVLSRL